MPFSFSEADTTMSHSVHESIRHKHKDFCIVYISIRVPRKISHIIGPQSPQEEFYLRLRISTKIGITAVPWAPFSQLPSSEGVPVLMRRSVPSLRSVWTRTGRRSPVLCTSIQHDCMRVLQWAFSTQAHPLAPYPPTLSSLAPSQVCHSVTVASCHLNTLQLYLYNLKIVVKTGSLASADPTEIYRSQRAFQSVYSASDF